MIEISSFDSCPFVSCLCMVFGILGINVINADLLYKMEHRGNYICFTEIVFIWNKIIIEMGVILKAEYPLSRSEELNLCW